MAFTTLDPADFALEAGYFPHEANCLCDFCLPWDTCTHFHGGDCEHTYDPQAEAEADARERYEAGELTFTVTQAPVLVASGFLDALPFD